MSEKEYIERDEIYRAVGKLPESFRVGDKGVFYAAWRIDEMVGSLPAADVAPVVRCAKCVFRSGSGRCTKSGLYMVDNGFCSYGKDGE